LRLFSCEALESIGGYDLGTLVIGRFQLDPLLGHERSHDFLDKLLTLRLRFNGVQDECVLHEELPQVFAVFTVVFECGVMFAEMLGDCFTDSLLQPLTRFARRRSR
jgi:hypothetical protein